MRLCSNSKMRWPATLSALVTILSLLGFVPQAHAKTSVWKVTSPNGGTLYLGGSLHILRAGDYPLPPAYNRAFDLSQRIAMEVDPDDMKKFHDRLSKAALYPSGDELRKHVDPRTYAYVTKVFSHVPPAKLAQYRPWFLVFLLRTTDLGGRAGVESYFRGRSSFYHRNIEGLESAEQHAQPFTDLSDRQSEAFLLISFINAGNGGRSARLDQLVSLWRRGEAEQLVLLSRAEFRELPGMDERLLGVRNRAWIPKLEGWIRSGKIYFVLAGAAHMGGPNGLLSLLRAKGYQIEQW